MNNVRLRFAPSPTGFFHVGGARTALYNWLLARKQKGSFILRIEDTDISRSSREMTEAILRDMEWLGMDWDEGPFYQSERTDLYKENARKLLESGLAYRCYCTREELEERRAKVKASGSGDWRYDRKCRDLDGPVEGKTYCLRFIVPDAEVVDFDDNIYGKIEVRTEEVEDFVILRTDGSPTYQFTVVSDDVDMGVNHVVRGNDHITNTPKQILLYRALGAEIPEFSHLPLILGGDKKKLSKRHGAASVGEFRKKGILPEALVNYLALLGWSPGDDREFIRREELKEIFSIERINPAGAVFDEEKLAWLNGLYISEYSAGELLEPVKELLDEKGLWSGEFEGERRNWFLHRVDLVKSRARTLNDLISMITPYISDEFDYDEKAVRKRLKGENLIYNIERLIDAYRGLEDFTGEELEKSLRSIAEELEVGAGKLIHPLRIALTGQMKGPGAFLVVETVGKEKTVERLKKLVIYLKNR